MLSYLGIQRYTGRTSYKLLVVHISDYVLRLRSPWRRTERGQRLQEVSASLTVWR
jgi:hypothetical protein